MSRYVPTDWPCFQGRSFDDWSLHDAGGVLEITLVDKLSKKVRVSFDDFIAYRKLDGGDALRTVDNVFKEGIRGGGGFIVENSHFLSWLVAESYQIRDAQTMKHFCIITVNSVIDILAFKDPNFAEDTS